MSASTQLCSVSDVKQYLSISDSTHDALLGALVDGASEAIENFCRRRFATAEYTEYHDGGDSAILLLDHCPVQSVDEVRVDSRHDFENGEPIDEDDYVLYPEEGLIVRIAGLFSAGTRNVRVIYTAGYAEVPNDVNRACVMLAAAWFNRGRQGADGIASEKLGDYAAKYASYSLPPQVTGLLTPYLELSI
jgi:uncharacterized phiE125 gp8 family phage protein